MFKKIEYNRKGAVTMNVFERLSTFMKMKGLFLQCVDNPAYKEENKEMFIQNVNKFCQDTHLKEQIFWRSLPIQQRDIAYYNFELLVDPGFISYTVPSNQAAIFIVLTGRATVDTFYDNDTSKHYICGMGKMFGAYQLFEDPLGRAARNRDKSTKAEPREIRTNAEISSGGHLLRLNIMDFIQHVLGIDITPKAMKQEVDTQEDVLTLMNPLRNLDPVRQRLKPKQRKDLYDFFDRRHLIPSAEDQAAELQPVGMNVWKSSVAQPTSYVQVIKKNTKVSFSMDEMPTVGKQDNTTQHNTTQHT